MAACLKLADDCRALLRTGSLVGRVAGFGLDTRTAWIGATGGSIVTAGTGSVAIGGASLTGGETVGAMGEVLGWSTTGASSLYAGSMVSVDYNLPMIASHH